MTITHDTPPSQAQRAAGFHALHAEGLLVLPNAWDPLSAAVIRETGASAIATTSAGIAWSLGYPDGELVPWNEALQQITRIVAATDLPVTVDIEGGYADVATVVEQVVAAGAVGINIEDSRAGELLPTGQMVEHIAAARQAAERAKIDLFINARTDPFLLGLSEPLDAAVDRARAYLAAGADGSFVPGVSDLSQIRALASAIPAPLNVMVGPGSAPVEKLHAAGARRISSGMAITQLVAGITRRAARALLDGDSFGEPEDFASYDELNRLCRRRRAHKALQTPLRPHQTSQPGTALLWSV